MWSLPMPANDDAGTELSIALTYVNGTPVYPLTLHEKNEVLKLYGLYDQSLGRPVEECSQAPNLGNALKNAIHTAYNEVQIGGRLRSMREQLMLAADRCPLCGIGPVTDLDHHLPHSVYCVVSIYSRNLVPMCHTCNNKKRTVAGETPDERFVHVYFDEIPKEIFLRANTSLVEEGLIVDYEIIQSPKMPDDLFASLRFQVERLKLKERYKDEINVFLSSQIVGFMYVYGPDYNHGRLRDFIIRSAESLVVSFGLNDWRTALVRSLADCVPFCEGGFLRALGHR